MVQPIHYRKVSSTQYSIADTTVEEGDIAIITITRTGMIEHTGSVRVKSTEGTASAGSDFTNINQNIDFWQNETSHTISINTKEDSIEEENETFTLSIISGPLWADFADVNAVVTITDDDTVPSYYSINDVQGYEGDTLSAKITRTGDTSSAQTINVSYKNGTGFAGFDFNAPETTISFAAGESSKTFDVETIEDSIVETDESFTISLSSSLSTALFSDSSATLTILNDDSATQTNIVQNYTYNIDNSTKYTVNIRGNINVADTLNVINVHNKFIGTDAIDVLRGSSSTDFGEDLLEGGAGNDDLMGLRQADFITGGVGNDFVHGNHGKDSLFGGQGLDTIRGGHGADLIQGNAGSDWIWGGIGSNEVKAGANDGVSDEIYVPVDAVQNSKYGNPKGANRDLIKEIDASDKLYLHGTGITDSMLTYANDVLDPNGTGNMGVGIYANGTLEALVIGSGLNATQIDSITTGGWYA